MSEKQSKYSLFARLNFEDLYNAFLGLEQRQQTLAVIGGIVLCLLIIILPISCASSKLGGLDKQYTKSRKSMNTFMGKIHRYQSSQASLASLQKDFSKGGNQSLSTVLESLANEEGIRANIDKLRPVNLGTTDYYDEVGVDAIVSKVTLQQVIAYLHRIENHKDLPMKIKKLQIKPRYGKRQLLNVTFQVSTLKLKGEQGE